MTAVDIFSVILRAGSFVGLFQAAGMALFLAFFGRYLAVCAGELRRIGRVAAVMAGGLLVAQYGLEAGRMGGDFSAVMDPSLQGLVLHSPAATTLAWRLAGLALVLVGLRAVPLAAATGRVGINGIGITGFHINGVGISGVGSSGLDIIGVVGATLAVAAFALMGHTSTHPDRWLLSLLLLAHVLIIAFWFGALVPLYLASKRETAAITGAVTEAFSSFALWLVPLLFLAGLLLAVFIVGNLAGLSTTYGALLLAKVAGFALLMALAALNKWHLGPALAGGDGRVATTFRRSLAAEYALIVVVLCVTAVMTAFYSPD